MIRESLDRLTGGSFALIACKERTAGSWQFPLPNRCLEPLYWFISHVIVRLKRLSLVLRRRVLRRITTINLARGHGGNVNLR